MSLLTEKEEMVAGLTVPQCRYLEEQLAPKPRSDREMCEELQVHKNTLTAWRQMPEFRLAKMKLSLGPIIERAHEISTRIANGAAAGDFKSQQLWWEMMKEGFKQLDKQVTPQTLKRKLTLEEHVAAAEQGLAEDKHHSPEPPGLPPLTSYVPS